MRALHILPITPYPANTGGRVRARHILEHTAETSDTTVVALYSAGDDIEQLRNRFKQSYIINHQFKKAWYRMLSALLTGLPVEIIGFRNSSMSHKVNHLLKNETFDVIFCHFLRSAQYVPYGYRNAVLVLDQQNLDSDVWDRFRKSDKNPAFRILASIMHQSTTSYERKILPHFDLILSCSSDDLEQTARLLGYRETTFYAPNGVDVAYFQETEGTEVDNRLLFFGYLAGRMNEDAVLWFVDDILPYIALEIPDVRLDIVGKGAGKRILKLQNHPNVNVVGLVPDLRPFFAQSAVVVAPLRLGGGTKIKVLESMAAGKAIVSTLVGVQGINVIDGHHLLVRDSPTEFAYAVVGLLKDPYLREHLGVTARRFVAEHHSWDSIAYNIVQKIAELVDARGGSTP